MPSRRRSRESALQMIYQWDVGGASPEQVIEDFFGGLGRDGPVPVDPFAERIFRNVAGEAAELDEIIRRHASRWSPERMSLVVRFLLRLAISELRSQRVPARIVIDEALEIGKRYAGTEATGFLNGVLDSVRREFSGKAQAARTAAD